MRQLSYKAVLWMLFLVFDLCLAVKMHIIGVKQLVKRCGVLRTLLVPASERERFPSRGVHSELLFPSSNLYHCLPGQQLSKPVVHLTKNLFAFSFCVSVGNLKNKIK